MELEQWAKRHSVGLVALNELRQLMGYGYREVAPVTSVSEAAVSSLIRLQAANRHWLLWRNNVGAFKDGTGRLIRTGLCNDSAQLNRVIKSSDLIGLRQVDIKEQHLGTVMAQFVAIEVKKQGWCYSGTDREKAQKKFIEMVTAAGGAATFSTGELPK